jgi:hypothetical protein
MVWVFAPKEDSLCTMVMCSDCGICTGRVAQKKTTDGAAQVR